MANNLFADVPAAVVATQTISFASAGFDTTNTRIIYEVGSPLKSYVPGRAINAVTGFTLGNGYYIVPKLDMDKSAYLIPPIVGGGGGGGSYDAATEAWATAESVSDTPTKDAVDAFVLALKAIRGGAVWTNIIYLNLPSLGTLGTKNLRNTATHTVTLTGTYTRDSSGISYDGSTGYGNPGVNDNAFTSQDKGTIICYVINNPVGDGGADMGGGKTLLYSLNSGHTYGRVSTAADQDFGAPVVANGRWIITRVGSTDMRAFRDGAQFGSTSSLASSAGTGAAITHGAIGGASAFTTRKHGLYCIIDDSLSDSEAAAFDAAMDDLFTAIGI